MEERQTRKSAWEVLSERGKARVLEFCDEYLSFLSRAKTEREAAALAVRLAEENGFVPLEQVRHLQAGDRVYGLNRKKQLVLAVIGRESPDQGINVVGAHLDSPRLDFKPEPLYEDQGLALAKTHYYGGLRKYQWVGIPLALHGFAVRTDGSRVAFVIGEKPGDPVFTITDLLPHLGKDQAAKKLNEAIAGEALNIILGGIPIGEGEEKLKASVLQHLAADYNLSEEDLISAEIEAVPAWSASSLGFDRGLVGGYGQDDRVCAYTALRALLAVEAPEKTAVVLLTDKEEIGSMGNTGMQSNYFLTFVQSLLEKYDGDASELRLRRVLSRSLVLSADVNAGTDPNYAEVMDKYNAAVLGRGVVLTRYCGARGKYDASEASAEFMALIRRIFNQNQISWQTGELGKVDQGGGGTIAWILANYNMDVVDCGVALLGMHSTFEVASKADIYMAFRAYKAFLDQE
ncbi:MAG: aminopeptidase [Clostridia bacterium]|nr:aminopeptidase [Clostridia bacterium]